MGKFEDCLHKKCKGLLFKDTHRSAQPDTIVQDSPSTSRSTEEQSSQNDDDIPTTPVLRKSERRELSFKSGWLSDEEKKCILCKEDVKDNKGHLIPITLLTDKQRACPTLKEFSDIHVQLESKYKDGAKRLLNSRTIQRYDQCERGLSSPMLQSI